MEAIDFRIDNFVQTENGEVYKVESVHRDKIVIARLFERSGSPDLAYKFPAGVVSSSPDIEPIPLTEEWLNKFGFVSMDSWNNDYQLNGIRLFLDSNKMEWWLDSFSRCRIEYVHQLQNLYFALTGEELVLK